jgi:hypothetical protein
MAAKVTLFQTRVCRFHNVKQIRPKAGLAARMSANLFFSVAVREEAVRQRRHPQEASASGAYA